MRGNKFPQPKPRAYNGSGVRLLCTREVHTIARVEILGPDGQVEILEGTTIHPIWSEDRNDWVPLGEIEEGEQLQAISGAAGVLTHTILQRSTPVYNIEVHGEHVYQVGDWGLLVHNVAGCIGTYKDLRSMIKGSGLQAHHLIEKRFASVLGEKAREMMSIVVNPGQHQIFTNAWRAAIPYDSKSYTASGIKITAQKIYANYPAILDALGL